MIISMPYWRGKIRKHFDSFPPWSIYKTVFGCGFLLSLSALMQSGVPAPEAIRIIMRTANPWYKERLSAIRFRLLNGDINLGEALYSTQYMFPSKQMIMDLRSYAALGGFDDILHKFQYNGRMTVLSLYTSRCLYLKMLLLLSWGSYSCGLSQVCLHCNSRSVMQHNFKRYYYG